MKERPILFSTQMVQAILAGRKTQTRRICKHQHWSHSELTDVNENKIHHKVDRSVSCPYGNIGDVLWVRETWCYVLLDHAHDLLEGRIEKNQFVFKGQMHEDWMKYAKEKYGYKWKPSIHMPKEACRLKLRITDIRVERLHSIKTEGIIAEGLSTNLREHDAVMDLSDQWERLWININGEQSWADNPWVWVIEFETITI